jgi:glycosyltransferase involved in cell wall biosynthesis
LWKINRPDLVHVATEGPLGASAITLARSMGIPATSSFHTNFDQYTRDYRIGWFKPVVSAWLRHVHNRTLRTFAPTGDMLSRLASEGYTHLRLLSRGVDTELFSPARRDDTLRASWGVKPDEVVVLHVGRMAAEKNYPLLFRVFDALKAVEPRARLVLVGDGPLLAAYQRQRPDAIFTGFYTGINLARHYASGDLYLHASNTETFGNVITEAMASGLAVSAFDYAAAHEFIRHGQNGLVAPLDRETAFFDNAIRLVLEPDLRRRLSAAGRATAEKLSWDTVIDRFAADLTETITEHHAASANPKSSIPNPKLAPTAP